MAKKLSAAQLAYLCRAVGIPESQIPTAVAIAFAESSGIPDRRNPVPPDDSYGLWQINMLGSMGPARRKQFGLTSNAQLYNPMVNARAMAKISNGGTNWRPWSTYTNGAYRLYLPQAHAGMAQSRNVTQADFDFNDPFNLWPDRWGDAPGSLGGDSLNDWFGGDGSTDLSLGGALPDMSGLTSMASSIAAAGEWLSDSHNWVRVAYVSVGGALVLIGLGIMAKPYATNVASGVAKVLPQGKALGKLTGK